MMDQARGWLPALEREFRRRVGWADAVLSPFSQANAKPKRAKRRPASKAKS
jgi:hypothetical protein